MTMDKVYKIKGGICVKRIKKTMSLLLCLMMLFSMVPMQVFAADTVETAFEEIPADAYYRNAVLWAEAQGIVSDAAPFAADIPCTRSQAVTLLWRAYGAPEHTMTECRYTDVDMESESGKAILWAVETGIITPVSEKLFATDSICTRNQVISMIYRNVQAGGGGFTGMWMFRLPFTDATEGDYEAIAWCYKEGITNGTSATTFSPALECTYAHMVTFLHNALGAQ